MSAHPLELRLLGEFSLIRDGVELPSPTSRKGRILVAKLALNPGHRFLRDELAVHLWPGVERETARFNLRQLLARIRRAAPDVSACLAGGDHSTLGFDPSSAVVDVFEFRRLAHSDPRTAIDHYRGSLVPGLQDEWLARDRTELRELYVRTLEKLASSSEPREAITLLRRAVEAEPFRESTLRKLLVALAECGDLAGAQAEYRRFQTRLHTEIHGIPAPETTKLLERLLSSEPSPVERPARIRRPAHRLPVPTSDILGREAEVGALGELLSENRIVTLLGPGGVGKTRLAIEAGAAELDRRPEGVWFADLSLVSDGSRVAEVVGRALGLRGSLGMGWLDAAVDLIGETNRLLILDNCEHVIEESSRLVEALAEACPAVRILATSRVPLGVRGELRFPVEPLELPAGKPELGILAFPALRLFEARARLVAPRFSLNRESIESTVEICRHVDGLPLGIEMAAARLASMTLADLRGRLSDSLEILRNPVRGSGPRHSTLRGVIEWSYELLPETAKRVLARIAVFEGGWTLEAAQSVCSDSEVSAGEVLDGLTALVEACLVQFRDGRYALLETVRSFANGQLTDSGELTSVRRNLRRYLGSALRDVESLIFSEGPDVVEARFRYELGNLRIALADALTDPSAEDLNLVTDAARVFSTAQLDGEAGSWLEAFLTRPNGRGAPPGRMRALRLASSLYQSYYSDIDRAVARANTIRVCEELGELSRRSKDPDSEAVALTYLAWIKLFEDPAFSRSCCERAIELSNSAPASSGPQRAMAQLGYLADNAEASEEGRDWFKRAEEAAQRRGDQATLIFALHGDSHTLREECRYADSIERLKQIERVLENWRDARASAFNDMRFAELYFDLWEFDLMSPHLDRARGFFEATPSRFHGMMLDGLSRYVAAHRGDVELAADGLTNVLRRLVSGAQVSTAAWWNGAAIELEALCVCLAGVGRREDAARVFGAARAFRNRDRQFVSKSVEGRWERLNRYGGFERFDAQIQEGSNLTLDEVLSCVVTLESSLVNSER